MEESAGRRAAFGVGWSTLTQIFCIVIRFLSSIITTRLLFPADFGILGTAFAILQTLEWLADMGVQPALVRHPNGDKPEYLMTGWLLTMSRDIGLASVTALCAWPLAQFYHNPTDSPEHTERIYHVVLALSLTPILRALRSPGVPNLQRSLDYRGLFFIEVGQTLFGTIGSITLAFVYQSVWSLVGGVFIGWVTSIIVSYYLCPVRPRWMWNARAKEDILVVGRQILLNTMVMALWMNFNQLLGLRFVSEADMGVYFTAWNLAQAAEAFTARACDVHFSYMAGLEGDGRQIDWHRIVSKKVALYLMPLMAIGAPAAPLAIRLLYDNRYQYAGILLAIFLCRLMARAFGQVQNQYLIARGTVWPATVAYLVALLAQAALFLPACNYGVKGMAYLTVLSTTVWTATQALLIRRLFGGELFSLSLCIAWTAAALALVELLSRL